MRLRPAILLAALLAAGCATRHSDPSVTVDDDGRLIFKPVVAVIEFENRAGFQGQWKLGEGMAELLTASLLDADKLVVLERRKINDVVSELDRQGQALFREEGRVQRGRLMNAQYLVRGVVTDFTVTQESSGWIRYASFGLFGGGSKARVALNIYVVDVASGKVLVSVKTAGTASAGGAGARVDYKDVSFGGDSFFRTPLGRATEKAIDEAVKAVLHTLPGRPWEPLVADVQGRQIIFNGGANVRLQPGALFLVREAAREVTDPATGNVIERIAGRVLGRVQVSDVLETSAHGVLVEGEARRGDRLEPVELKP